MAAILGGKPNALGQRLTVDDVEENVFGVVIMNDWSARDIQGYEMVPLGPFVGKNVRIALLLLAWSGRLDKG